MVFDDKKEGRFITKNGRLRKEIKGSLILILRLAHLHFQKGCGGGEVK
jgi:hypothetical protein